MTTYKKKFKCIEPSNLKIWGDYNSRKAQQLVIQFKMCEGHDYCESEENIREWLKQKFVVLLYNQKTFGLDQFDENVTVE